MKFTKDMIEISLNPNMAKFLAHQYFPIYPYITKKGYKNVIYKWPQLDKGYSYKCLVPICIKTPLIKYTIDFSWPCVSCKNEATSRENSAEF